MLMQVPQEVLGYQRVPSEILSFDESARQLLLAKRMFDIDVMQHRALICDKRQNLFGYGLKATDFYSRDLNSML